MTTRTQRTIRQSSWPDCRGAVAALIRAGQWRLSPIGAIENWPPALKTTVEILLQGRQPGFVCWGRSMTTLYNDAAIALLGNRHPRALGRPYAEIFPEAWNDLKPVIEAAFAGEPQHIVGQRANRGGEHPASWNTYTWTPVRDEKGKVAGLYCVATETSLQIGDDQLRIVLEHASDAVSMFDLVAGRYVFISTSHEQLIGFSADELKQFSLAEIRGLIHPDDAAKLSHSSTGEPFEGSAEFRCKTKSGEYRWFSVNRKIVRDPNGRAIAAVNVSRDIHERKTAELENQASRATLEAALESMNDAVYITDAQGRFLQTNTRFATFHRYHSLEECASDFESFAEHFDVYFSDCRPAPPNDRPVPRALRGESAVGVEYHLVRKDSGESWVGSYSFGPIRNANGVITGAVITARDITERKRAEIEIAAARATLEAALSSMTDGVCITDKDGRILHANRAFVTYLRNDGSRPDTIGAIMEDIEIFQPDGTPLPHEQRPVPRALAGETGVGVEYALRRKDTGERWIGSYSFGPIRDAQGAITGAVLTARDITEAREAAEALRKSEARRAIAVESADMGTWEWDLRSNTAIRSAKIYELLGIEPLTGADDVSTFWRMVDPEDLKRVLAGLETVKSSGRDWRDEFRVYRPDGSVRWLVGVGRLLRDPDGSPRAMFGVNYDITREKQAEAELKRSEARYRLLHESLRDGYVHVAMDGRVLDCNDIFCEMVGYSRDELARLTYIDLTPERWRNIEALIVEHEIIPRGYSDIYEKEYRRKDGSAVPVELRTILARDDAGNPASMWALVRDMSEKRAAEARMQSLKEQLMHAGRVNELSQVSAGIAHELNQPLAAMLNYSATARRLIERNNVEAAASAISRAGDQAARAGAIIRRMRDFVEKRDTSRAPDDINAIVQEAAELGLIGAKADGIAVQFDLEPGLPPAAVDRVQIEQVLVNLMHNAMDAMTGSPERRLTLTTNRRGGAIEVSVSDTGCGIPQDMAEKMFEPFVTTKPNGMGIGLAISRTIIEAHRGDISVSSKDGLTVFRFTVPIAEPAQAAVAE
jgi:two-component system sensor kinase FixL